jgi:arsenate reductase (thioredoxin)
MLRVLIICTGNSARSQMAEGLLRSTSTGNIEVHSAGTRPSRVNPLAIDVMKELGVDISGHRSKSVDEFAGQEFNYVITVCDSAREACPVFAGNAQRLHWSFQDPAAASGSVEEKKAVFRRVRDQIAEHLRVFVESLSQNTKGPGVP